MLKQRSRLFCVLDIGADFPAVAEQLGREHRTSYTEQAAEVWSTVVWNTIILSVHRALPEKFEELERSDRAFIAEYVTGLESNVEAHATSTKSQFARSISDKVQRGSWGLAAAMVRAALESDLHVARAMKIVEGILEEAGQKINVLIDTLEFYKVGESQAAKDCMKGLLNCCSKIDSPNEKYGLKNNNIECRLFFPDELTEYVKTHISHSVEKDFKDVEHIRWSAPELAVLSVIRLREGNSEKFPDSWKIHEVGLNDAKLAQDVLHRFLPILVSNDRGVSFECITYLMRHTQLTPRQFLIILNSLTHRLFLKSSGRVSEPSQKVSESTLHNVLKKCTQETYSDILGTYRDIYPAANKVLHRLLPRLPRVFSDAQLRAAFVEEEIKADFSLDFEDVKSCLSDIGAVGKVSEQKASGDTVLGEFSYRTQQRLILSASFRYCIHPIFSSVHPPIVGDNFTVHPEGSGVLGG